MNNMLSARSNILANTRIILVCLVFLNAYIELPLVFGGDAYIPSFFLILVIGILAAFDREIYKNIDFAFVVCLFVFNLLSAVLAPNFEDINSRFFSAVQLLSSSVAFVVVVRNMIYFPTGLRVIIALWGLRVVVLLTLLEYLGLISSISDEFRAWAYSSGPYVAYSDDARDLLLGGAVRPKVFTSEPSLVAMACFVLAVNSTWLTDQKKVLLEVVFLLLAEVFFLNSPIIVLSLLCVIPPFHNAFPKRILYFFIGIVLLATSLVSDFGVEGLADRFSIQELFYERGGGTMETETSERLRLVYPYISVIDAIQENPATGLGVGGKRSLSIYGSVSPNFEVSFGNNAFATVFIFYGVLGAIAFYFVLYLYLNKYIVGLVPCFGIYFLFSQATGGFESARYWVYLGFLTSVFVCRDKRLRVNVN